MDIKHLFLELARLPFFMFDVALRAAVSVIHIKCSINISTDNKDLCRMQFTKAS